MARGETPDATESRTLLSRDYAELRPVSEPKESVKQNLSNEITAHKFRLDNQTYLDRGVSWLTDGFSGKSQSLERLKELQEKVGTGEPDKATEREIRRAIADDQSALATNAEITKYGSSMIQTAGLFVGGKKGVALSALTFAAGAAKPEDDGATRTVDMALGASKGVANRLLFGAIGKAASIDIPSKAFLMGGSSRLTESVLNRSTFVDNDGNVDVIGGTGRVFGAVLKPEAVVSDLVVFGGGQLAMSNSVVRDFAKKSALSATMASASAFGLASGSAEEASRQYSNNESFDLGKIVGRGILRGGTDAVASIPGGLLGNRDAALRRSASLNLGFKPEGSVASSVDPTRLAIALGEKPRQYVNGKAPDAMPTLLTRSTLELARTGVLKGDGPATERPSAEPRAIHLGGRYEVVHPGLGGQTREFRIVGENPVNLNEFRNSRGASALLDVREVAPNGQPFGPTQRMLVQHVDADTKINSRLAQNCDLIASCNPQSLLGDVRAKHIFPDANGPVYLSQMLQNRIRFDSLRAADTAGSAIPLGAMSVSDLLRLPSTADIVRTPRPLDAYAREMKHFKDPALRVIDGGADSIVLELADGRIMKMTDRPYRKDGQPLWRPEWGFRTLETESGPVRFDARLLTKPTEIQVNHEPLLYYIQERARTPVSTKSLLQFHDKIDRDGNYVFWDGGVSSLGHTQLGYVKGPDGNRSLVLLDYDAVRKPADVPKDYKASNSGSDHWMNRYRADRVDWESIHRDR